MWGSWVFGVRFAEGGEEGEIIKQVKSRFFHVQKKMKYVAPPPKFPLRNASVRPRAQLFVNCLTTTTNPTSGWLKKMCISVVGGSTKIARKCCRRLPMLAWTS